MLIALIPQGGVKINPLALRPGAGAPGKPADDKAVTFADPPKVNTLPNLTKVGQ